MQADAAQHHSGLKQQCTGKVTGQHKECASTKTSRRTKLCVDATEQVERAMNTRESNPMTRPPRIIALAPQHQGPALGGRARKIVTVRAATR